MKGFIHFLAEPQTCAYFQSSTQEAPVVDTTPFKGKGSFWTCPHGDICKG